MRLFLTISIGLLFLFLGCNAAIDNRQAVTSSSQPSSMTIDQDSTWNKLSKDEEYVIVHKGTERPWTGKYVDNKKEGIYQCKRCDTPLFTSESKFDSRTGWPSFDDFIGKSVEIVLDEDGYREEIVCNTCKGHLGHVFYNEGFTDKNTRHCVNSISLQFVPEK